ncbi:MAG: TrkH family potassium uptake protein [Synergistaceae bacterium]|nr:TrkH family potassium uptake protein [Synergistaceae bacterium]
MKFKLVFRVLSLVSLIVSLSMLFPMIWAVIDGTDDFQAFALSLTCGVAFSFALFRAGGRGADYEELGIREALAVVGLSWVIATAVGALPYVLTDVLHTYTDAFFETMSGFTTTGTTVMTDIEKAPRGLLFWRGMTQWLGGMGIVVLSLAILPFLGVGGLELYKFEAPGPTPEKLTPRMQQTALFLWGIYVLLTAMETVFLMFGGMTFFDALTHSFATISTGGFSPRNASIAHYRSPYVEWVVTFFMFLGGVNFSLHFFFLTGFLRVSRRNWSKIRKDDELRFYFCFVSATIALIVAAFVLNGTFSSFGHAARAAAFQAVSLVTTTGFFSENYVLWPTFTQILLLLLIFVGGCAGSTTGGLKMVRLLALVRTIRSEMWNLLHPRAILRTKINGKVISQVDLNAMTAFFMLYLWVLFTASLVVTALENDRLDVFTAFSGVLSSLSNTGPGFGALGPLENHAWLPAGVKWVLSFCMLAGRLELYAVILLFFPSTWRR